MRLNPSAVGQMLYDVAEECLGNVQKPPKEWSEPYCNPHKKEEEHNIVMAQIDKEKNEEGVSPCSSYHV